MPTVDHTHRRLRAAVGTIAIVGMLVATSASQSRPWPPDAPRVIIDTDLSRYWDDATAIGLANVLRDEGRLRILGIVSDIPNPVAVAALDAINTAYGHPRIPLGAVTNSDADTAAHGYTDELVAQLPHSVRDSDDVRNAVVLYRHLLARAPDHSVTIVSLGAYTNLAGLLMSSHGHGSGLDGRALVAKKVKRLVVMDGVFPSGTSPVTNQRLDLAAARVVVGDATNDGWPTPIAWADGRVGIRTLVGGTLCTTVPPEHPMRIAYEALFDCGAPGDGNWDAPTLLYAIGDIPTAFSEQGQGGSAVINDLGGLSWQLNSTRPHDLYVRVVDQQLLNQRIEQLLTEVP